MPPLNNIDPEPRTPTGWAVRLARTSDAAALVRLIRLLAAAHGDESTATENSLQFDLFASSPWATALVAEQGREIVGYALLIRLYRAQFAKRVMDLHHLFVLPEARKVGVGTALVQAVIAEARAQGCRQVSVGTHPDNELAQIFYRQLGFAESSALSSPAEAARACRDVLVL